MNKRKVFYFGLEPLKARYTYQLCKEWIPATFEPYKDQLEFVEVEGEFDPDQEIKVGAFPIVDEARKAFIKILQPYSKVGRI